MITSKELVAILAKKTGCTQVAVRTVLEAFGEVVADQLQKGLDEKIALPGLGRFSSKLRAPRTGRHPQTGVSIMIPAQRVPVFAFSSILKAKLNEKKRATNTSKGKKKK